MTGTAASSTSEILLLGCGQVAGPAIRYWLEHGLSLTIAANNPQRARALVEAAGASVAGRVVDWSLGDIPLLRKLVEQATLVVSLLPAAAHAEVAQLCVDLGKHLVTASYTCPRTRALDSAARAAGVAIVTEVGLDPGIDHMSAMQVIHRIQAEGSQVLAFRSECGGLPADAACNPWGYKLSWRALSVLSAILRPSAYLESGERVELAAGQFYTHGLEPERILVGERGPFEVLPNGDATSYREPYGLSEVQSIFRGTLRHPGWTETVRALIRLDLLNESPLTATDRSWAGVLASRLGLPESTVADQLGQRLAEYLGLSSDHAVIARLRWLGLLSAAIDHDLRNTREALARQMQNKMAYGPSERDLVVMRHQFDVQPQTGTLRRIVASLVVFGNAQETAMAVTVGLPVAIVARGVAAGRFGKPGVQIPVSPEIYEPVLAELAGRSIAFAESDEQIVAPEET